MYRAEGSQLTRDIGQLTHPFSSPSVIPDELSVVPKLCRRSGFFFRYSPLGCVVVLTNMPVRALNAATFMVRSCFSACGGMVPSGWGMMSIIHMRLVWALTLAPLLVADVTGQNSHRASRSESNRQIAATTPRSNASQSPASLELPITFERRVGDLDGIVKRHEIRALVMPSHSGFFFDKSLGRSEADRSITNEPWSSMQRPHEYESGHSPK